MNMRTASLSLVALTIGALASPLGDDIITIVEPGHSGPVHMNARDASGISITAEEMRNFKLYAQYAGAAYCNPVAGQPIYCKGDICPAGGRSNATIFSVFHGIETDILGFIAVDPAAEQIVVSVRGSASLDNWLADVVWARTPSAALCNGCWAHLGFLFAYSEVAAAAAASLTSAARLFPHYRITIAGHSLGGAVATLLAARVRAELAGSRDVDLYTYGSPRVGNEALARFVSSSSSSSSSSFSSSIGGGGNNYRLTHAADLVARLPPLNREFRHVSPEYWLAGAGPSRRVEYGAADVAECEGYASVGCSAGAPWWELDVTSHLYYLVAISHCGEAEPRLRLGLEGPLNGTTATNVSEAGLPLDVVDALAMFAKLDQVYAGALEESGGGGGGGSAAAADGGAKPVF